jgi:hypothetical protein
MKLFDGLQTGLRNTIIGLDIHLLNNVKPLQQGGMGTLGVPMFQNHPDRSSIYSNGKGLLRVEGPECMTKKSIWRKPLN